MHRHKSWLIIARPNFSQKCIESIFLAVCVSSTAFLRMLDLWYEACCARCHLQTDKDPKIPVLGVKLMKPLFFQKFFDMYQVYHVLKNPSTLNLEEVRTAGCNFPGLWCSGKSCGQALCWWCNLASKSDHKSTIESTDRWFYWVALVKLVFNCNSVVFLNSKS